MPLILGVDGGGSKTHAVLVDEYGAKLGSGVAGRGNHQGLGVEVARQNIWSAAEAAMQQAGVRPEQVDFVQYGLAGADRDHDFNILRSALATLPFRNWDVVCDTLEGLRTGSSDNVGIVLVCGSGTNAMGRTQSGRTVQTGGFGYLFGDTAGGYHMAMETFRAAVRSIEYREAPSILPQLVAQHLGFATMQQVVDYYLDEELNSVPYDLTRVLHAAADQGDGLAIEILKSTGRELGVAANSVARRLQEWTDDPFPIVLVGSVLQKGRNPHLLGALRETVLAKHSGAYFVIPEMAPVYGAVLLGMDQLGLQANEDVLHKFVSYGGYEL